MAQGYVLVDTKMIEWFSLAGKLCGGSIQIGEEKVAGSPYFALGLLRQSQFGDSPRDTMILSLSDIVIGKDFKGL